MMIDFLIVGAGLFGAVFARQAADAGKKVLVIDRRDHIAGNVFTEKIENIHVHRYGAHIFHTNDEKVWQYVQRFAHFNRFTNSPVINYKGKILSLPFNMHTFNQMWDVVTPEQALQKINSQKSIFPGEPQNLEEQALSLVGRDIYETCIKGYTEKQWGKSCDALPAFIIKRLPLRFTYDNNYFDSAYQGIPTGGYTSMVENMLEGIDVRLNESFIPGKYQAEKIIYTGPIDEYFDYCYGALEYRSLRFENEIRAESNVQGNAVVNYTDIETPWTRIIEHKWFTFGKDEAGNPLTGSVITKEYSCQWQPGAQPYYPINDKKNNALYQKYKQRASQEKHVIFGGRLGSYQYLDMDQVISAALECAEKTFQV